MLFTKTEEAQIVQAIRAAENNTSGEIRVYVEDFCLRDQPVERAAELFHLFGMFNTRQRNAVLIYLADKSRHFAFWGDVGINEAVGFGFWNAEKQLFKAHLQRDDAAAGLCAVIEKMGEKLKTFFPADPDDNPNELPDEIIYG
ncbi:MAG: TPM domain-containing protein [Bacteroidetes bacterium]|nr:TPM domain-containing protein [Bacteroidota bacterium]